MPDPLRDLPARLRIAPERMRGLLLSFYTAAAAGICAVSAWGHMLIGMNNDHLALMDQVRKLLAGGIPYVDYTDVSPPLIHLIYAIPFCIAQWAALPLHAVLNGFTLALIGAALWLSSRLLAQGGANAGERRAVTVTLGLALLAASFIHQAFADRDHLVMVLAMPWFVLYSPLTRRAAVPVSLRGTAAAMAAVGFAIKPYFYLFHGATLLFTLLRERNARGLLREREQWIVAGFALFYALGVFAFFPHYALTMLPLAWQTYGAISWPLGSKLAVIRSELLAHYAAAGLVSTGVLAAARRQGDARLLYLLLLLAAGMLSYLLNGGWFYTQYPFIAAALVLTAAAGAALIDACGKLRCVRWRSAAMLAVYGVLCAAAAPAFLKPAWTRAAIDARVFYTRGHPFSTIELQPGVQQVLEEHLAGHPRFLYLSTNSWSSVLAREWSPREHVGRFHMLWPLPGIVRMQRDPEQAGRAGPLMTYMAESLAADLERHRPDMVAVDTSPYQRGLPPSYDIIGSMREHPRFALAWQGYAPADTVDMCRPPQVNADCAFRIYYRK